MQATTTPYVAFNDGAPPAAAAMNRGTEVVQPWRVGPLPVVRGEPIRQFPVPNSATGTGTVWSGAGPPGANMLSQYQKGSLEWQRTRASLLRDWGRQRETGMHREPNWVMDQLVSGTGLYPPRMLNDDWFSDEELAMIHALTDLLQTTGFGGPMARDMLSLKIYDVDIRIIVDDSGSMGSNMFGTYANRGNNCGNTAWDQQRLNQVFGQRAFR